MNVPTHSPLPSTSSQTQSLNKPLNSPNMLPKQQPTGTNTQILQALNMLPTCSKTLPDYLMTRFENNCHLTLQIQELEA